ncbi:glutaredoxin domain-containing protein [Besnoitia besnoiti]|uniref:Glutaredoxin domain-containing protein n=1 Tax=Besnoitia besnoiti TaxID=94643 RepID=A0A2A9MBE0_BESBE|nr:glutaredoxin domain-containing protein [Besnoitia besnoiti]PFH32937.1 glutaredoxin domain-containing protein [Besnoitia besnoiti]
MAIEIKTLTKSDEVTAFRKQPGKHALLFWQASHGLSQQMKEVFDNFREDFPTVALGTVDVTNERCLAHACSVTEAPTTLFYEDGEFLGRLVGAHPPMATEAMTCWVDSGREALQRVLMDMQPGEQPARPHAELSLPERLRQLINSHPVMVFMKGKREAPFCRFSKQLMAIFAAEGLVLFGTFDVFDDEQVREGLKTYSNWPTYPQVYVKGELIGGVDIIRALCEDGTFADVFPKEAFA